MKYKKENITVKELFNKHNFNYIAKDKCGSVYAFDEKPEYKKEVGQFDVNYDSDNSIATFLSDIYNVTDLEHVIWSDSLRINPIHALAMQLLGKSNYEDDALNKRLMNGWWCECKQDGISYWFKIVGILPEENMVRFENDSQVYEMMSIADFLDEYRYSENPFLEVRSNYG